MLELGRIVVSVSIENILEPPNIIQCNALVDTGASFLILPSAWKSRLGKLEIATQEIVQGEVGGPVKIQIEGFRPIYNEVLFVEMKPQNGTYEPLIGYIILEQCQAAVDMVGHRLMHVKRMDLK